MEESITRPHSLRSSARKTADERVQSVERKYGNLGFINDVVESVVRDIMGDMDRDEMLDGLEAGILRCSHVTHAGDRVEISAIDLENLTRKDACDESVRQQTEQKMTHLADSSFASLGTDTVESLFSSIETAADDNGEFLAIHEIDDISFFTVISHDAAIK